MGVSAVRDQVPIQEPRHVVLDSGDPGYVANLLIATPTRGLVRIEWHAAVRGMLVPPNWSAVSMVQRINEFFPVRFTVADAQNVIVREALSRGFEWLLLLEDDTIPPPDLLVKLAPYMRVGPPVVSGLYYTKSNPSEPLIYRGRGNGSYLDFKRGQQVWADGVPTGCLLVHTSLLREMWNDAPEYSVSGQRTREVFVTPMRSVLNGKGEVNTITGTSDLDWCSRVIEGDYLRRAGWKRVARRKYPFLVDTSIFCGHITTEGQVFP